jgi:hypothetical protein
MTWASPNDGHGGGYPLGMRSGASDGAGRERPEVPRKPRIFH